MRKLSADAIAEDATALVKRWTAEQAAGWSISAMFITAGNFVPVLSPASAITRFFKPAPAAAEAAAEAGQRGDAGEGQAQQQHAAAGAGLSKQQQERPQEQQQQPQQDQQQHAAPAEAAGPSGSTMPQSSKQQPSQPWPPDGTAGPGSSSRAQQFEGQPVDESVLAELPPELQKEIRAQMKLQQMAARMDQRKPGGSGSKWPASRASTGGGSAAPAGTQRIDAFLKGKRPKR